DRRLDAEEGRAAGDRRGVDAVEEDVGDLSGGKVGEAGGESRHAGREDERGELPCRVRAAAGNALEPVVVEAVGAQNLLDRRSVQRTSVEGLRDRGGCAER